MAIVGMPLQKAAVLFNTNSVFTVVFGIFYLKEIPNLKILVLIFFTAIGVILMIDPSIVGLAHTSSEIEKPCNLLFLPL